MMRNVIAVVITVGLLLAPATSQAQSRGALQGFGGVSPSRDAFATPNLGGTLTFAPPQRPPPPSQERACAQRKPPGY